MKKLIFALILILITSTISMAHPGRTASDGCHYCRTRCDYWGVPWNERHCHGSSYQDMNMIDKIISSFGDKHQPVECGNNHTPHDKSIFIYKLMPSENIKSCTDS